MPEEQAQVNFYLNLINTLATAIGGILAAWYIYRQKLKAEHREAQREENEQERLKWEAERAKEDARHRHRMEELQIATLRQGGAAAKHAREAKTVALKAKEEIKSAVEESQKERREQIGSIATMVEDNTKLTKEAIEVANNYNEKIALAHQNVEQVVKLIDGQDKIDKIVANTDATAVSTQKLVEIAETEPPTT